MLLLFCFSYIIIFIMWDWYFIHLTVILFTASPASNLSSSSLGPLFISTKSTSLIPIIWLSFCSLNYLYFNFSYRRSHLIFNSFYSQFVQFCHRMTKNVKFYQMPFLHLLKCSHILILFCFAIWDSYHHCRWEIQTLRNCPLVLHREFQARPVWL